mgnify:CR=1 FL=1
MSPAYNVRTFNSRRSPVFARRGLISTSQPLASAAGLRILLAGGNAVDAAVAAAAVLGVVNPYQTGLGGDAFALVSMAADGVVRALNASGPAPAAARLEDWRARGLSAVPEHDPLAWTVPGCVDGWAQMIAAHGRLTLREVLQPAIEYAAEGFPVSPCDAHSWALSEDLLRRDAAAARTLLRDGRAPRPGEVIVQPDLARTLAILATDGRDAFYEGEIAERLVAYVERAGGLVRREDLSSYRAEWTEPVGVDYRGLRVLQCPPNGQGLAALVALAALRDVDLSAHERHSAECWHLLIEATKLGMEAARRHVADPRFADVPVEDLLAGARLPGGWSAATPDGQAFGRSDTVYLAVVDGEGNAVSFINSIFGDFGSGHLVPGLGFLMQNRGAGFSLDPAHPNRLEPGKRPLHTIIPAMALRDGAFAYAFGLSGGHLQPQGQVQLLASLVDHGLDVQSAVDAPRFWWKEGRRVAIEEGLPDAVCGRLASFGHEIARVERRGIGGAHVIAALPDGVYVAGAEPRQDGCAVGY